jgi:YcxB-like protein
MSSVQTTEIEITFSFSREDYLHFIDFWLKRNRRVHGRWMAQRFGLLLGAYLVLFLLLHLPVRFAVASSVFLAAFGTWFLRRAQLRRFRRVRQDVLGERTTRIGPEGIFGQYPTYQILNYWQGITEIGQDDEYLFFFTSETRAHVVPKRAFTNSGGVEQFRDAAKSYWISSRKQQPPN